MISASIKYESTDWDVNIRLIVTDTVAMIIPISSASEAVELNRVLTIASFEDAATVQVSIGGNIYNFTVDQYQAIIVACDLWLAQYMPATHPQVYQQPTEPTIGFDNVF